MSPRNLAAQPCSRWVARSIRSSGTGDREFHKETQRDGEGRVVAEVEAEVTYALGSGTRGISYLLERDGRLYQSPIAWYGQTRKWDLARTGYERRNFHFDRVIVPECLFCHANRVRPVDQAVNRYEKPIFEGHAIGCERCHGPGALHVQGQELVEGRDVTIVNPRHLEPALREAVCEQCHLQGDYRISTGREPFDYRPGLALSSFIAILNARRQGGNKVVGHVEQMHVSRCYLASSGGLGCISCHDPHAIPAPAAKTAYYKQKCLTCHDRKPCSLPDPERLARSPDDRCVLCHMPTSANSDVVHNATTDHRDIASTPGSPHGAACHGRGRAAADPLPCRSARTREAQGDVAQAGARADDGGTSHARAARAAGLAQVAIGLLDQALARWPGDLVALRHKGQALVILGRPTEGLRIYDAVLKAAPNYEKALDGQCRWRWSWKSGKALRLPPRGGQGQSLVGRVPRAARLLRTSRPALGQRHRGSRECG